MVSIFPDVDLLTMYVSCSETLFGIMSALGRTAYLNQSTIIKQGCSSQGSHCVNDLWMIDYPLVWAPGGSLLAKHRTLYYAILNCGRKFCI